MDQGHFYKDILGKVVYKSKAYRLLPIKKTVVLAYHSISDNESPVCCTPKAFADQCRFFAHYFDVVSVGEILELIENGGSLKGKVAITFDDGYKDNAEIAADILSKYSLPATFFVATQFVNSTHQAWWDERDGVQSQWMSWDDVRQLKSAGFTIGGHTQHHVDLGIVSAEEARAEISGCVQDLLNEIGERVDLFAYPYGGLKNINEGNLSIIKDLGFNCCFSCYGGIVSSNSDVYSIERLPISSWHVSEYHLGAQILRDII